MAERVIDRQELVRQLRLPPRTVRRLIENYREWLSAPQSGRFTPLDLARLQIVARMSLAGRSRSAILDALATTRPEQQDAGKGPSAPQAAHAEPPAISSAERGAHAPPAGSKAGRSRREARSLQPVPPRAAVAASTQALSGPARGETEVAAAAIPEPLVGELGKLRETIMQNAERERQDRDRVLMALVRTQQEVSHLRSELGTLRSRRDRKRSFMSRLLG